MIFIVVWLLYHFKLKSTPSVNCVWIMTFFDHIHVWVKKFKPLLVFFQLPVLTLNKVIWVKFPTVLFDKTQHVVNTSTAGYVPVCYEMLNLFVEPQNFLFMSLLLFFIRKLKGLDTVCKIFNFHVTYH